MPKATNRSKPNLKSRITSALRQVWRWSPERRAALERARLVRGRYQCNLCGRIFGPNYVQVDHIEPVVDPAGGFQGWDTFIDRLFCSTTGLQVICKGCHAVETAKQRKVRSEAKRLTNTKGR